MSSLSRSSATPVSGSQPTSHLQLPPNLSPQLQSSSYSKAASWLRYVEARNFSYDWTCDFVDAYLREFISIHSTVPGLSPVPRPTPPPTTPSSIAGHPPGVPLSLQPSTVTSPFGGYPGVPHHHGLASPHPSSAAANMFAPPILPLSSISSHPASQPPTFGPGADPLYPGKETFFALMTYSSQRYLTEMTLFPRFSF